MPRTPTTKSLGIATEIAHAIETGTTTDGDLRVALAHGVYPDAVATIRPGAYTELRFETPDGASVGASVTIRRPELTFGREARPARVSHSSSSSGDEGHAAAAATVEALTLAIRVAELLNDAAAPRIETELAEYDRMEAEYRAKAEERDRIDREAARRAARYVGCRVRVQDGERTVTGNLVDVDEERGLLFVDERTPYRAGRVALWVQPLGSSQYARYVSVLSPNR